MLHLSYFQASENFFSDATLSYFNDASKLGYQRIPQLLHSFILVLTRFFIFTIK